MRGRCITHRQAPYAVLTAPAAYATSNASWVTGSLRPTFLPHKIKGALALPWRGRSFAFELPGQPRTYRFVPRATGSNRHCSLALQISGKAGLLEYLQLLSGPDQGH